MNTSCRSTYSLHYLDSWNKHCGGDWGEFASRTITISDSLILAYAGIKIYRIGGLLGKSFGSGLIVKSSNDIYEAWTGNRGPLRNALGDKNYLAIDIALIGYGFFKKVPRINYLGNPMHDFFVKDPLSYEYAFKQYSKLELGHALIGSANTFHDEDRLLAGRLYLEQQWEAHISRLRFDDN